MGNNLNHLLYSDRVRNLNLKIRNLHREGCKDLTELATEAAELAEEYLNENSQEYLEAFNNLSAVYFQKRDFELTRKVLVEKVERIDVDLLNSKEKEVYTSLLNNLGVACFSLEKFALASKYLIRAYELKKKLNYGYYQLQGLAEDIAGCYIKLQELEKARYYWADVSRIAEQEFGTDSYEYLDSLSDIFNFLDHNGFTQDADHLGEMYTAIETKLNSRNLSGKAYDNAVKEAIKLYDSGNFAAAVDIHKRIVVSAPKLRGPLALLSFNGFSTDPLVDHADKLDKIAHGFQKNNKIGQAIKIYEEIIEIVKTSLGNENLRVAYALSNLGDALIDGKKYREAKTAIAQSLKIISLPINREDKNRVKLIENYARAIYTESLEYAPEISSANVMAQEFKKEGAPKEYARSLRIKMFLPIDNETPVESMLRQFDGRVTFYESVGNYDIVLKLLENIVEISEAYYFNNPEKTIEAKKDLANGHLFHASYGAAEKIYLNLLDFAQENLNNKSLEYIAVLQIIGDFYGETGNLKKCRRFLEKAIAINDVLPEKNKVVDNLLKKDLITALYRDGSEDAKELMQKRLAEINPNEIENPTDIETFASYYMELKQVEKADDLYKKSIAILKKEKGEWNLDYALAISNLATSYRYQRRYQEALVLYLQSLKIREVELGQEHPKLNASLVRLALTYAALAEGTKALETIKRVVEIDDSTIDAIFSLGSQEQKLAYLRTVNNNTDVCFSIIFKFFANSSDAIAYCIQLIQKRKSILGDSLLNQGNPNQQDPEKQHLLDELESLKKGIAAGAGHNSANISERANQRVEELEKLFAARVYELKNQLSLDVLKKNIPSTGIALEVLNFKDFQFEADVIKGDEEAVSRYIAFLVDSESDGASYLIDFGSADVIDNLISEIRKNIAGKIGAKEAIKKLSSILIEPVLSKFDNVNQLIICPDGDLSLLPFDLLLWKGQPLIDSFIISFAEKFKELIQKSSFKQNVTSQSMVIAFPDYFMTREMQVANLTDDFIFAPLEATLAEGQVVARLTNGILFTGEEANKKTLENAKSPLILHIATHAFYGKEVPGFENMPLLKSGLALAGANIYSETNYGIITAEEISFLDLQETELVVLSACDTGRGEKINREGVFGLEKAFKIAGAKRLAVSLWEVPDKATNLLMEQFYSNLYQGNKPSAAMRNAKLTTRERFPEPVYWASFVITGGLTAFSLNV